MFKFLKFFISTVCCVFTPALSAQVNGMVNYTQEHGLYASYTYMLSQDRDGYIWIGSDNGIFRFDGVEFKNYNTKNGLKNMDVLQLFPMADGEVFVSPFMSNLAYLKGDSVYDLQSDPELRKMNGHFTSNLQTRTDSLKEKLCEFEYINPKELFIYNKGRAERKVIDIKPAMAKYSILNYDFKDQVILIGMRSPGEPYELFQYSINRQKLKNLNISFGSHEMNSYTFGGASLFVNGNRVAIFHSLSGPPITGTLPCNIYWVRMTGPNELWISFDNGGVAYYNLRRDPGMKMPVMLLEGFVVNDVMADRDGHVWFSTKDNGLFFMSRQSFNNYVKQPIKNNSSYVTGIAANQNAIILAYNRGSGSIFKNNTLHDLVLNKNLKYVKGLVFANDEIAVFGLGSTRSMVNLRNPEIKFNLPNAYCKNLVPYTKESVLFCTSNNLAEYNFVSGRLTPLLYERTYSALPFDKDSLFVGSFSDLYKFNTVTKSKKLFLSGYYFNDLKRIDADNYIGATNGNGLVLFNRHGVTKTITTTNHLVNDQVKGIEVQDRNTFWAATNSGLCRVYLKKDSLSVINFTRQDGLFSDKVTGCVIRRDTIYVGTEKGLTILPIKNLLNQPARVFKKVLINSVTAGHKTYSGPVANFSTTYPENNITFHVSFLDYGSLGKISYRYKIEGLNDSWQESNSSRILLTALPPGKYVLKVFGLNYNGKQSYVCTQLPFEVEPRFWQSRWFQLCAVLLLCLTALILVNKTIQKRRDKKLKTAIYEKKIAELELQALKAQINPHFIYNCLNSIQFLLYRKSYGETETYLEVFAKMIRKTLHYSEKTFMPIAEETEYLTLYLDMEKLRFKTGFLYEIRVAETIDPQWKIPSLLIQPFVENALKHGIDKLTAGKGFIEVLFDYQEPMICITIRDNGIGIKSKLQTGDKLDSFGIKLSQKRIDTFKQLFNTDILFEINDLSEKGMQGTEIKICLNKL